ncbi:5'-methylthioadenosine/adenosylhomocysteine nucleosidase [Fusibacter bizertensis]
MKYGIIGAMDLETKLLIEEMQNVTEFQIAGMHFYEGRLSNAEAVVVTSGVGKVNAAACAQILVTKFNVQALINTGVSGALHHDLEVGDIVISTDCMEHDVDVTVFGYKYGIIPRLESSVFIADNELVEKAYAAGVLEITDHKVLKGRIVSGDQFVSSIEKKSFLVENFEAFTTEMEGAAIAHVATINQIPFVIIRAMSDKADGSAHVSFDEFAVESAHHSSKMVINMLK